MLPSLIFLQTRTYAICQTLLTYEVFKDLILPIVLTLIASGFAYLIFVVETRRDKNKELATKKQMDEDKLSYFANLIQNIVSISEQLNENILDFVEKQLADPTEVKQLSLFSLNDFRRATTDLNLEDYMLAYVSHYNEDRKFTIKKFNNIIARIDMLHSTFSVMEPYLTLVQEDERNEKEKFNRYTEQASRLISLLASSLRQSGPQLQAEMNEIARALSGSKSVSRNSEFYYHTLIVPFNRFAFKHIQTSLPERQQMQELAAVTRDAMFAYEKMVSQNEEVANEFREQYERLKPEIQKLKDLSKRLVDDFWI